jgi:RNA polymerase sigma-70 factor (ECF subfamily)
VEKPGDLENQADHDLVAAIAAASEPALAEVYRRYGRVVFATSRRLLGDDALAEDIVQEVMVRLWDNPHAFDARRGTLRTFLLVSSRNRCIDVLRSGRSRQIREQLRYDASDALAVEDRLDIEEDVVGVSRALAELSAVQRQVIELAYFDGLTYRHIAKLLELPEGTVKSRIRLALARMRRVVAGEVLAKRDVTV